MEGENRPGLDPQMTKEAKRELRIEMKALRGRRSAECLRRLSGRIVQNLLESMVFSEARGVALFWPMMERGEVDLRELDKQLRARGTINLFYPFMGESERGGAANGFRRSSAPEDLKERGHGFFEPPVHEAEAGPGDIDVVLVPALAVDSRGHRLGYGAGFYDRMLENLCPPAKSFVTVFSFQQRHVLPVEAHDKACDAIVTDEGFFST